MDIFEGVTVNNQTGVAELYKKLSLLSIPKDASLETERELMGLTIKLEAIDLLNKLKDETLLKKTIDKLNIITDNIKQETNGEEINLNELLKGSNKSIILKGLFLISLSKDAYTLLFNIKEIKEAGLSNEEITIVLKNAVGTKYGTEIFLHLGALKEIGLSKEEITIIIKEVKKSSYWDQVYINIPELAKIIDNKEYLMILLSELATTPYGNTLIYNISNLKNVLKDSDKLTLILKKTATSKYGMNIFDSIKLLKEDAKLNSKQITIILKEAVTGSFGINSFDYVESMKLNGGLSPSEIAIVLKEAVTNISEAKKFELIEKIIKEKGKMLKEGGLDNLLLTDILNSCLGEKYLGFDKSFIENYSFTKIQSEYTYLGKDFCNKYSKYFKDDESLSKFIELITIYGSTKITKSINEVHDYYDKKNKNVHNYVIENEMDKKIVSYSTEELISSLGNHTYDLSITFKVTLNELNKRINGGNYLGFFNYIDNNDYITDRLKLFMKGQIIIGLSAKGRIEKLSIITKQEEFFVIIDSIINYKENDIFTFESYMGFITGLRNLMVYNNTFAISIYNKYYKNGNKNSFNKTIELSLALIDKKLTNKGIEDLKNEEKEKYKEIKDNFLLPNEYIFDNQFTPKDMVYFYKGDSQGGGEERYNNELNYYKRKFKYTEVESGEGYSILEKDGIRVSFFFYSKSDDAVEDIFENNNINPCFCFFRGHNSDTSFMIKGLKNLLNKHQRATIVDGGCKNVSAKGEYIDYGITNQLAAYTDTGKGNATFNFARYIISRYLRHPEIYKNKNITLEELTKEILSEDSYIVDKMRFPGDLYDIMMKIESGDIS